MSDVLKLIGEGVAYELDRAGLMVVPRPRAAPNSTRMDIPQSMIPQDRAYQWMHMEGDAFLFLGSTGKYDRGWSPVTHEQHDGYFAPHGRTGHIIVNGCGLFSKPKFEVVAEQKAAIQRARDQSDKFFEGKGFTGTVTVLEESGTGRKAHVEGRKAVALEIPPEGPGLRTEIPSDLGMERYSEIMTRRDNLLAGQFGEGWQKADIPPATKDRATRQAIDIVRAKVRGRPTEVASIKSIEDVSDVPADMAPHYDAIFAERDRIAQAAFQEAWYGRGEYGEAFQKAFVGANRVRASAWPIMNALVLPKAIELVRNRITQQEPSNGTPIPAT